MVALEELLERLDLPEDTQELLEQTEIDDAKYDLLLLADLMLFTAMGSLHLSVHTFAKHVETTW